MAYREETVEIENEASNEVFVNGGGEFTTTVTIFETLSREIEISSPTRLSSKHAVSIVEDLYDAGEIILDGDDVVSNVDVEAY